MVYCSRIRMVFSSVLVKRPTAFSLPIPLSAFVPPNGTSGGVRRCWLTQTIPASEFPRRPDNHIRAPGPYRCPETVAAVVRPLERLIEVCDSGDGEHRPKTSSEKGAESCGTLVISVGKKNPRP